MLLLSSSPPMFELLKDRVSSSPSTSSSSSTAVVARFSAFSGVFLRRSCCFCSFKVKSMAEITPVCSSVDVGRENALQLRSRALLGVRSTEDLLSRLKKESECGSLPVNVAYALEELYNNYRNAVFSSENPHADEIVLANMSAMLDCVFLEMEDAFVVSPYHKALREPYDYFTFGQNYIRPLIDFSTSFVGNIAIFREMEEKRRQGHNIILMSNHQSEADPASQPDQMHPRTLFSGLIRYMDIVEPYQPDRCMRQFGYVQVIPTPMPRHVICHRSGIGKGFRVDYGVYADHPWEAWPNHRIVLPSLSRLVCSSDDVDPSYMSWYKSVSHPLIIDPHSKEGRTAAHASSDQREVYKSLMTRFYRSYQIPPGLERQLYFDRLMKDYEPFVTRWAAENLTPEELQQPPKFSCNGRGKK